jgi:hypothetical protein
MLLADVTIRAAAAALLHSLWQGALVAAITGVLWWALRGSWPTARYALGCVALALMVGGWAATAWRTAAQLIPEPPSHAALATPRPVLGPGLFDYSPAIRTISQADLEDVRVPLGRRLDVWSIRLVPLWLAGVFGLSFRLALSWWLVQRMRRAAHAPVASLVADRVPRWPRGCAWRARCSVVQSDRGAGAGGDRVAAAGDPAAGERADRPEPAQLDAILAHELAHVRRHDFAVNLLQTPPRSCSSTIRRAGGSRGACAPSASCAATTSPCRCAATACSTRRRWPISRRCAPTRRWRSPPPTARCCSVCGVCSPVAGRPRAPGLTAALVPRRCWRSS